MNPLVIVYMLAGVGVGLGVYRAVLVFRWQINIPAVNRVLVKLVRANNLDRVIRVCAAAPQAYYLIMVRHALEVVRDEEGSNGLRRAAAMQQAFSEIHHQVMELDRHGPLLSLIAGLASLAAAGIALLAGLAEPLVILAALLSSLGLAGFSLRASSKLRRQVKPHFQQLVEAVRQPA